MAAPDQFARHHLGPTRDAGIDAGRKALADQADAQPLPRRERQERRRLGGQVEIPPGMLRPPPGQGLALAQSGGEVMVQRLPVLVGDFAVLIEPGIRGQQLAAIPVELRRRAGEIARRAVAQHEIGLADRRRIKGAGDALRVADVAGGELVEDQRRRLEQHMPAGIDQAQAEIGFVQQIGEGMVEAADWRSAVMRKVELVPSRLG